MRIPAGTTDRYVYFVGVDATDFTTRETGLTGWVVYYSINGGTATVMTTPTVNQTDATNMPGVYELLIDESGMTTLTAGNDAEELCIHIEDGSAAMAAVSRVVEIYRPETTEGNTLGVASTGDISGNVDGNVDGSVASVTGAVGSVTGHTNQTGDNYTRIGAPVGASISVDLAAVKTEADKIALADAGAGVAGSVVEEVENRATPTQVGAELATYDGPTNAEMVARTRLDADYFSWATDTVANVTNCANNADMVGTNSAALATVCTEARLSELDAATGGKMANQVDIIQTDTTTDIPGTITTLQSDTDDIQTRLPAALVGGAMDSDVSVIQTDAVSAAAMSAGAAQKIRDEILPTQNAAFNNMEFLFVAASDHVTPVTGAGTMAVTRSIDGGAFGAGTGTGPAEVGNGIYQYDASAADMNGGIITFRFTATSGTPGAPDDTFVTVVTGGGV